MCVCVCVDGRHVGKSVPFSHPFQYFGRGTLGVRQTVFTENVLLDNAELFDDASTLIHYCYGAWQDRFQAMKDREVQFHERIPNHQELVQRFPHGGGILIMDDLMDEGSNDKRVLDLFTKHSHHQNVTVLYLCQDMLPVGKYAKSISRNAHYIVAFKTPGINWECATCSFNRFPPRGKTVWTPFIVPRHDLTGIWCSICIRPPPMTNGC